MTENMQSGAELSGSMTSFDLQIKRAQANSVLDRMHVTLLANTLVAGTSVTVLWLTAPGFLPFVWLGFVTVVNMVRLFDARRMQRRGTVSTDPGRALWKLSAGAGVGGLLWAVLPLLTLGDALVEANAYVTFIACGISMGAVVQSFAYSRTALLFAMPPLMTTTASLLMIGSPVTQTIASTVVFVLILMFRASLMSERNFIANQSDRLQAVQLAGSLSYANAEITKTNAQLEMLANRDPLTGLANRAAFNAQLRTLVGSSNRAAASVALLIIDLDRFKSINDTMGHRAGDQVLTEFADRLTRVTEPRDMVIRLGGDEFAVVIHGPDANARATTIGTSILAFTRSPVSIGGHPVTVGSSVGLALYPEHGTNADDLFASADIALYAAKDQGRRCLCVFNPEIRRKLERQRQVELGLEAALVSGDIYTVFQPQVDLITGVVIGFEALVRWTHPQLGPISPPEIVQAAHSIHASRALTHHVARAAARLAVELRDDFGLGHIGVAVNVSPREFSNYSVSAMLEEVVRLAGIEPRQLEVEITEEAILDTDAVGNELARLDAAGFRLAVDDFGMGHSSLAYLVQLRIDRLKVDRSLTAGVSSSRQNQALISALLGIGNALDIDIVLEGLETQEDAEVLRALGCRQAQGYLFAIPMRVTDLRYWLGEQGAPALRGVA